MQEWGSHLLGWIRHDGDLRVACTTRIVTLFEESWPYQYEIDWTRNDSATKALSEELFFLDFSRGRSISDKRNGAVKDTVRYYLSHSQIIFQSWKCKAWLLSKSRYVRTALSHGFDA